MPVDVFTECRSRLTAKEVARTYGLEFDRRGRNARCIFHPDKHPSMTFKNGRFRCWSCGANGTCIDLTMQLFGLTPLEAVRKLNDDFRLNLPVDKPATPAERRAAEREARRRQDLADTYKQFEAWRNDTIDRLNDCFRLAHLALKEDRDLTPGEVLAVREQAHIEYLSDTLLSGDMAQKMAVFRDRKEVDTLCKRVLENTPMKSSAA